MKKSKKKVVLKSIPGDITPEFQKMVKKFMDEHNDTLRELAKR